MEDIGDLVFYIMAALFVLIGLFNKKKKTTAVPQPMSVDTVGHENTISVKEAAENARAKSREIIVSDEDFSWDEEAVDSERDSGRDWVSDTKTGQERITGKDIRKDTGKDHITDTGGPGVKGPAYSDGEWVEPMAAMFSHEGVSSFFKEEEKHIYDLDSDGVDDQAHRGKREAREESQASSIASRFNLAEAIVFSEILKRRDDI